MNFPIAQTVKNLPAIQETRVRSLGWEDPLEKASHSTILAWRIPRIEEPGGLVCGPAKSQTQLSNQHTHGNYVLGNSLKLMKNLRSIIIPKIFPGLGTKESELSALFPLPFYYFWN